MPQTKHKKNLGITLVELLIAVTVVGLLAAIAYPSYVAFMDRARNETAVADLIQIEAAFERFHVANNRFPNNLSEVGMNTLADPWDNPYVYLPFNAATPIGLKRKDKSLVPVNTDFDLYSMGKDGRTVAPFTAKHAQDDIVRANNGRYHGLADEY